MPDMSNVNQWSSKCTYLQDGPENSQETTDKYGGRAALGGGHMLAYADGAKLSRLCWSRSPGRARMAKSESQLEGTLDTKPCRAAVHGLVPPCAYSGLQAQLELGGVLTSRSLLQPRDVGRRERDAKVDGHGVSGSSDLGARVSAGGARRKFLWQLDDMGIESLKVHRQVFESFRRQYAYDLENRNSPVVAAARQRAALGSAAVYKGIFSINPALPMRPRNKVKSARPFTCTQGEVNLG
ncbi:hypothetical protein FB451DRAFT_1177802 [Mycena latifolia]|nr:hypothetical protein FB451DRAFT_1177802 [Mycena latifolia]